MKALVAEVWAQVERRRAERATRLRDVFAARERLAAKLRADLPREAEDREWNALRKLEAPALRARSSELVAPMRAALPALMTIHEGWAHMILVLRWADDHCRPEDPDVCIELAGAINASAADVHGRVPAAQTAAALTYLKIACLEARPGACGRLKEPFQAPRPVLYQIAGYHLPACVGGDDGACSNIGSVLSGTGAEKGDLERALAFYDTACQAGHAVSCIQIQHHRDLEAAAAKPGR
jgi:hypothetical protein